MPAREYSKAMDSWALTAQLVTPATRGVAAALANTWSSDPERPAYT